MALLYLPGDGPKLGPGPAMSLTRPKPQIEGPPAPPFWGQFCPASWKLGPCGLGETGSYDMIQTDVMNHSDTETTHCQNACSSYLWAQRPPPPQVQYSSLLFFCCCCLKAIIFHGCHLKFFNFKILAKKSLTSPGPRVPGDRKHRFIQSSKFPPRPSSS